jgi:hypothetical protein
MKQNENKASQSKQQKQCRSSRNGGSARMLSFEDRQKIAEREAERSRYESTKDDLIAKCHVFNGEDQCPSDLTVWKQYIWKYERFWVDSTINNDSDLQAFVQDYIDAGLKDFQSDDQTAIELKAIFYNRHCKHTETTDPEGFMQWYVDIYQQTSKQQTR